MFRSLHFESKLMTPEAVLKTLLSLMSLTVMEYGMFV